MLLACPTDTQQRGLTAQACDATLMKVNRNTPLWRDALHERVYLADEAFVQRMQAQAGAPALRCTQVPRRQRADPTTLSGWLAACDSRDEAVRVAHQRSSMTLTVIAVDLGLSVSCASQLDARATGSRAG